MQKFLKGEFDSQDKLNQNFADLYQNVKTYIELQAMVTNKLLVAGTQYLLSDYKTKYQQPDTLTIKEMAVERLVLTATSSNTFDVVCSSLDFPQDIIHYRFDLNKCEDATTDRNGFIVRRIDESPGVSIDYPLDWRTILWARWKPHPTQYLVGTTLTNYSVWTSGAATPGLVYKVGNNLYMAQNANVPANATDGNVFIEVYHDITVGRMLNENLMVGTDGTNNIYLVKDTLHERFTFGTGCMDISCAQQANGTSSKFLLNNVFGDLCYNINMGSGAFANTFGDNVVGISFSSTCYKNNLGNGCYNITFGTTCFSNVFGSFCSNITFGSRCAYNLISGSCSAVSFATFCTSNVVGAGSSYLNFGANAYNNILVYGVTSVTLAGSCYNNLFKGATYNITLGSGCNGNSFGINCASMVFGSGCSNNIFGIGCGDMSTGSTIVGNNFGNYKVSLIIKHMRNKNISAVSALESRLYTTTIECRNDGVTVYWSLNNANTPVYTVIA